MLASAYTSRCIEHNITDTYIANARNNKKLMFFNLCLDKKRTHKNNVFVRGNHPQNMIDKKFYIYVRASC